MTLYTITLHAPGTAEHGRPMHPMDPNPGHADQGMIVYHSRAAAIEAARYQTKVCDLGPNPKVWDATEVGAIDPRWLSPTREA